MDESKRESKYRGDRDSGRRSGCWERTLIQSNGPPAEKLTSWKTSAGSPARFTARFTGRAIRAAAASADHLYCREVRHSQMIFTYSQFNGKPTASGGSWTINLISP